jgi:hypothetical protein
MLPEVRPDAGYRLLRLNPGNLIFLPNILTEKGKFYRRRALIAIAIFLFSGALAISADVIISNVYPPALN